jgi:hypothetical protein
VDTDRAREVIPSNTFLERRLVRSHAPRTRQCCRATSTYPHTFVHEPEGNIDSWRVIGSDPCIVHFHILGTVEYLDSDDTVTGYANSATQHGVYLDWCSQHNIVPAAQLAMMPS